MNIKTRLARLIDVKSILTLILTGVFAWLACMDRVGTDFLTIYTVIIGFYFGTQAQKTTQIQKTTQNREESA